MRKHHLIISLAIAVFTSCSMSEEVEHGITTVDPEADAPVMFSSYITTTTRATDILDNDADNGMPKRGFGVFAYEQGTQSFDSYYPTSLAPNFMYNQQVTYTDPDWIYTPVKYWSNNDGAKHSFFAYAPYASADAPTVPYLTAYPESPSLILQGKFNGPAIYYKVPATLDDAIDLCWGEYNNTGHAALDIRKPGTAQKLNFTFHHALSRINFNAQIWTDEVRGDRPHATEGTPTTPLDANTQIVIRSLKLVGTMATEGILCLTDGHWEAQTAETFGLEMKDYFQNPGENFTLVNNTDEQYLFDAAGNDYLMLIPGSSFKIQIAYDIVTTNPVTHVTYSMPTNVLLSDDTYTLAPGKSYQFHLNLGLTSVKFSATVSDWTHESHEIDLPNNHLTEVSTPLPDFTALPTNITDDFLGAHPTAEAPSSSSVGKYYWDTTTSQLMHTATADNWTEVTVHADYFATTTNQLYTYNNSTSKWEAHTPPRFITVSSTTYIYTEDNYTAIATGTYPTLKDLLYANPATGLYTIGTTTYYYEHV